MFPVCQVDGKLSPLSFFDNCSNQRSKDNAPDAGLEEQEKPVPVVKVFKWYVRQGIMA